MSLTPIGDLGIALKADIDDYQKSMSTASDTTNTFRGMISGLSSAVRNMGLAMTAGAALMGGAMVGLATSAQKVSGAFREVDTIGREVKNSQEEYGELVSDLNTQFGLQADRIEVIDGLYQSVSAGVSEGAEAQREFLTTAAKLAVVGRVDLATTVDVLSTVMNTYGMNTDQAQDVSESLFQTVQFGKVRMEELAPVLGRVAALGSELDTQIDEIGASMAVLTRTGFDARVAATGLRNIFRAMMRPSETMQQMLRGIALENDLFADSMGESSEAVRNIANQYQNATEALSEFERKQSEARETSAKSSLALQEARLKIEAIEEDRLNQLPDLTSEQVKEADTVEELESVINDYQFKVNKARIEEEKYRQETEETQTELENLRAEFKQDVDAAGDLEGSIGNLVLGNQDFTETLVDLRKRANEQNVAFNELFPRTRALQGALALVGEDGQALTDIFEQMESGTFDAREAWEGLDESARNNFESFEAFKSSTEDVQSGDLDKWFNQATGEGAQMRNNLAQLKEVVQDLGAVFSDDVTNALTGFANSVSKISKFAKGMDETMRSNVSRFFILATAIGLVLGPLLLLGGQFALIAGALGPALIPILAISAGLFGAVASSIKTLIEGGEGATGLLNTMSSALGILKGFLNDLYVAFKVLILPELINFAGVLASLFFSLKESLLGVVSEGGGATSVIFNIADAIGQAVTVLSNFISANEGLIVNIVTKLANLLLNGLIPGLILFATTVGSVVMNTIREFSGEGGKLTGRLMVLKKGVFDLLRAFLAFSQTDMFKTLLRAIVILVLSVIDGVTRLLKFVGLLASGLSGYVVPVLKILSFILIGISAALNVVVFVLSGVITAFNIFFKVISNLFGPITAIISIIAILAAVFVGPVVGAVIGVIAVIAGLIAILIKLGKYIWSVRNSIIRAFLNIVDSVVAIFAGIGTAITESVSWESAGKNLVQSFIDGMTSKAAAVKNAAKGVANNVKKYLGFGSAPEGYGEEMNPSNWGKNATTSFAQGMKGEKGKVDESVKTIVPNPGDFQMNFSEEDMLSQGAGTKSKELESGFFDGDVGAAGGGKRQGMPNFDSGKDVVIEEGAITVGPFHGISDEELPEKVEEEVDRSLEDIVEEIKGSGHDSTGRL